MSSEVTVILPTKNEEHNLPRFLSSLPADIPLLVLDDSTDNTREVINSLRPHNTHIVTLSEGVAAKRQYGATLAKSDWLLFTDADIQFCPGYFDILRKNLTGDLVYGPKLSRGKKWFYYWIFGLGQSLLFKLGFPAASASNMAVRRQSLITIGGFDTNLPCSEDTDLVLRLFHKKYRQRWIPNLRVYNTDHRRLRRGMIWRYGHILSRTLFIYLSQKHLLPRDWLYSDWGYWR